MTETQAFLNIRTFFDRARNKISYLYVYGYAAMRQINVHDGKRSQI